MRRIRVCAAGDMESNSVRQVTVAGRDSVAVYCLDDGYYATDDICTHGEANLSEGEIDGDEIVCPFHLGRFDIRTGEATVAPCLEALRVYSLTVTEDGDVYLEIENS